MGRYYYNKKQEADSLCKIDIWWLKKYGYLNGYKRGGMQWGSGDKICLLGYTIHKPLYVELSYTQTNTLTGKKSDFHYRVRLVTTNCNYGGYRYWFICPLVKGNLPCNRRVAVLYKSGDYFGCRHCYELSYASRNRTSNPFFRVLEIGGQIEKIREDMTTLFYDGKPTRKFRRIMKLFEKRDMHTPLLNLDEKLQ